MWRVDKSEIRNSANNWQSEKSISICAIAPWASQREPRGWECFLIHSHRRCRRQSKFYAQSARILRRQVNAQWDRERKSWILANCAASRLSGVGTLGAVCSVVGSLDCAGVDGWDFFVAYYRYWLLFEIQMYRELPWYRNQSIKNGKENRNWPLEMASY